MAIQNDIRTAKTSHISIIRKFLSQNPLIHRHLDWREPLDWIKSHQLLILFDHQKEIDALFCSTPEIDHFYWLRFFACKSRKILHSSWENLFGYFLEKNRLDLLQNITLSLAYHPWMINIFELEGWNKIDKIIQFEWSDKIKYQQNTQKKDSGNIQKMRRKDLKSTYQIDRMSFQKIWQQSYQTFLLSYKHAGYATVLNKEDKIIGFQISTISKRRAHLARIAVHPDEMHQGVGKALVQDLLHYCKKNNIRDISVNTQFSNNHSIALYKKMGFKEKGNPFPLYSLE